MELSLHDHSLLSLSRRDVKIPQVITIPATASALPPSPPPSSPLEESHKRWLTAPHHLESEEGGEDADDVLEWTRKDEDASCPQAKERMKIPSASKESRVAEEVFKRAIEQDFDHKCCPHFIIRMVLELLRIGAVSRAVDFEASCLSELEFYIRDSRQKENMHRQGALQGKRIDVGMSLLSKRVINTAVAVGVLMALLFCTNRGVSFLVCSCICSTIAIETIGRESRETPSIVENNEIIHSTLQMEIDALLLWLSRPIDFGEFGSKVGSRLRTLFLVSTMVIQSSIFSVFIFSLVTLFETIVFQSPALNATVILFGTIAVALITYAIKRFMLMSRCETEARAEIHAISHILEHLECKFDINSNSYHFRHVDLSMFACGRNAKDFLLRDTADTLDAFKRPHSLKALVRLFRVQNMLSKAIWECKLNALDKSLKEIELYLQRTPNNPDLVDVNSEILVSKRMGLPLLYFALIDLMEYNKYCITNSGSTKCKELKLRMQEVELKELQRCHFWLLSNVKWNKTGSFRRAMSIVACKVVLFNHTMQSKVFQVVRNAYVLCGLQSLHTHSEMPLLSPESGEHRLQTLKRLFLQMGLDASASCGDERISHMAEKVKRSLLQLDRRIQRLRKDITDHERHEKERKEAVLCGNQKRCILSKPIYYHSSRFGQDGWDCCNRRYEDSIGCRMEVARKGSELKAYHHPEPWNSEHGRYECCHEESRMSMGCTEGFHPMTLKTCDDQ